jgi:hypothetical protein
MHVIHAPSFFNLKLREEVTGGWRKLHSEKPHNLYSSLDIIMMIKLRMLRWTVLIECIGKYEVHSREEITWKT